uniref:Uncharacterized protein n=1 Tax=Cucumis melo TaxID=3656 RepID=A0A9I9EG82_CUCME
MRTAAAAASAYVASRVVGLSNRPHLIFIDGHCKAKRKKPTNIFDIVVGYKFEIELYVKNVT